MFRDELAAFNAIRAQTLRTARELERENAQQIAERARIEAEQAVNLTLDTGKTP